MSLIAAFSVSSCKKEKEATGPRQPNSKITISSQASTDDCQLVSFDGKALVLSITDTLTNAPARYCVTFTK